jgi:hypothetical protein
VTEQEWLASPNPLLMLHFLQGKVSDRKLWLFAATCCRRIWPMIKSVTSRRAVELAEQHADGGVARKVMTAAGAAANGPPRAAEERRRRPPGTDPVVLPLLAARQAALSEAWYAARGAAEFAARAAGRGEASAQCELLRELVGNPFRPVPHDSAWRTPDVTGLARSAYEERILPAGTLDPVRLGVLADALEEAGCTSADLLEHLRGRGPHVRGCWAVDRALGK